MMQCPYCQSNECGFDCDAARTARQLRVSAFNEKRESAKNRLERMGRGEILAFEEELKDLKSWYPQPRIFGDELYRRVGLIIDLADQLQNRELSSKFRGLA